MAHAKTNTIMVFIQSFMTVLCYLLNYHNLTIIFVLLIVVNGIIICVIGQKIEKNIMNSKIES